MKIKRLGCDCTFNGHKVRSGEIIEVTHNERLHIGQDDAWEDINENESEEEKPLEDIEDNDTGGGEDIDDVD